MPGLASASAIFACLCCAAALRSAAQNSAPIRIEVASVRPHKPVTGDDPSNRRVLPNGRFVATGTSVRTLIRTAFAVDDKAIVNAPAWIDNETFDISAITADHTEVTTTEQFQQLMLSLLQTQFGFRYRQEQHEGPVYWMVLRKPGITGSSLKQSTIGKQKNISMNGDRIVVMNVTGASMSDVAKSISRRAGRAVEDHTDLPGDFDFQIRWASDPGPESDDASIFTVLKDQLGLVLKPARGPIETIFVESIAHPGDE